MQTVQMATSLTSRYILEHLTHLGAGVVKCLTANLEGKHHQVFFSGIDLFSELLDNGVYACGTLITNCLHFPPELKPLTKKGLKKHGDSEVRQAGNLVLSIWQDKAASL